MICSAGGTASPSATRLLVALKLVGVVVITFGVVAICNRDRGVPFVLLLIIVMLLFWTFIAKRTTFGRHVYAVGGNAEAARRAGINVPRVRIIVFMISSGMAGLGGIVLAARLNSVDLNAGGGTLLIDAIAAAVIGGMSLFGGRGEVRDALFGSLVIATIANGLNTLNLHPGRDLHHHGLHPALRRHARHRPPAAAEESRPLDDDGSRGVSRTCRETPRGRRL